MELLAGILFCCSVSLDGFTIGCSYGLRKFKASFYTNIMIALVSAGITALSLFCGKLILLFVPPEAGTWLGALFLLALGMYTVMCTILSKNQDAEISFCRKITLKESFFMALAVSLDAFSAGLGYSVSGHSSMLIPPGVGLCHAIFLSAGMIISEKAIKHFSFSKKLPGILSGLIIVAVGLSRLFL